MIFFDLERPNAWEFVDRRNSITVDHVELSLLLDLELSKTLESENVGSAVGADLNPAPRTFETIRCVEIHLAVTERTVATPVLTNQTFRLGRPFLCCKEFRLVPLLLLLEPKEIADLGVDVSSPSATVAVRNLLSAIEAVVVTIASIPSPVFQISDLVIDWDTLSLAPNPLPTKSAGWIDRLRQSMAEAQLLTGRTSQTQSHDHP